MKRILKTAFILVLALAMTVPAICEETQTEEDEWFNVLLLGGDSRTETNYERTDSMVILSANKTTGQMKMCSILRDTWVKFPGLEKSQRINAANVYGGPELSVATVNQYYNMNIEKYVLINMKDMVRIVDILGGVDVNLTEKEQKRIGASQSGLVHLDGKKALAYSRIRKIDNDFYRVNRQQNVLLGLAETLQNMDVDELMAKVDELMPHVQTNLSDDEMKMLAETGMMVEIGEIGRLSLPIDGSYESGYYNGTYKILPDFEKNADALHEFIYGTSVE